MIFNNIFRIILTRHAVKRAYQKRITYDMIEATIAGGRIIRFGKNNLKFIRQYKNFKIICVDEIIEDKIRIVTILKK